jgi:catechol 2,3-dioxygenase-like lactoylglutathione lyase family enzyme
MQKRARQDGGLSSFWNGLRPAERAFGPAERRFAPAGRVPSVLDHVSINASDVARSRAFYETALAPLGYRALMEPVPGIVGFFPPRDESSGAVGSFWVTNRQPVSAGHVAFTAPDRATVDAFHRAGLEAGGTDNGAPGPRPIYHEHYYGAFVLDPDGINVEAVCHLPAG